MGGDYRSKKNDSIKTSVRKMKPLTQSDDAPINFAN